MSDQFAAETATYTTTTKKMKIHAISGFRTRSPKYRVNAELRLETRGHQDQLI